MDVIIGLIAFIFVLGLIVVIHEFGHFIFARRVNILCREFAFGMGPLVYKKKKGETLYSIRAFPIGGFCAIAGEEVESDPLANSQTVRVDIENNVVKKIYIDPKNALFKDKKEYKLISYDIYDENNTGDLFMVLEDDGVQTRYSVDPQAMFVLAKVEYQIAPYNRTIGSKRKRDRALVIFGGPLMNFLLALVVFFIAGLITGFPDPNSRTLEDVPEGVPSYYAGLRSGDQIISLKNGDLLVEIEKWSDVSKFMSTYTSGNYDGGITVKYLRNGVSYETIVNPQIAIYSAGIFSDYTKDGVFVLEVSGKASVAGLEPNDEIIRVNGVLVNSWKEVYKVFSENTEGEVVKLEVLRKGEVKEIEVKPYSQKVMKTQKSLFGDPVPIAKLAIGISQEYKFSLLKSIEYSGKQTISSAGLVFKTLKLLFSRSNSEVGVDDLSSFLGIYQLSKSVAINIGFVGLLNLIGLLSVNVGLLNLFPIPALDGGRLVFIGYEAITKKKPNPKVETILITVTMFILFGFMIFAFYNDILRMIGVK